MPPMIEDQDANMSEGRPGLPTRDLKRKLASDAANLHRTLLYSGGSEDIQDLIVIGFGPAALAIAIALHDKADSYNPQWKSRKVKFLERQSDFAWHAGMLLPDAKMQISFLKDLANLRNPRSKFTFMNYLHVKNRLAQFSNLGTLLPSRLEFNDYMKWCASHFTEVVDYGQEVMNISPAVNVEDKFDHLILQTRNINGEVTTRKTRQVVIAVGGTPYIPKPFQGSEHARTIHSSEYGHKISQILSLREKDYKIAVVGSGQSAAEVFNDLHSRFPNSRTTLIIRDTALRPSDDSPFVNEIFNPEKVSTFYNQPARQRSDEVESNKHTNYSVVRGELLGKIYDTIYHQSIKSKDKNDHQHRIMTSCEILDVKDVLASKKTNLIIKTSDPAAVRSKEKLECNAIVLATGYTRNAHLDLLRDCQALNGNKDGSWQVGRDYRVKLDGEFASQQIGIWLQGCNESTHGLSDSLLSVLATRSGELVDSIFGSGQDDQ